MLIVNEVGDKMQRIVCDFGVEQKIGVYRYELFILKVDMCY